MMLLEIDIDTLHRLFTYDPETGVILWKERDRNLSGVEAGGICPTSGYRRIKINSSLILAHRIAIAMVTGKWPEDQVDHINGVRADNRLANLRAVSRSENLVNKGRYRSNTSGVTGVSWHRQHRKWIASINRAGRRTTIGLFHNLDETAAARREAEKLNGFHPNHGRASS